MRWEVQSLLETVSKAAREDLPVLLGELEVVRCTALARLTSHAVSQSSEPDRMLAVDEAASRLNVSKDYLYRHAPEYPFTRRIGSRLLFSSIGIEEFIRHERGQEGRSKRRSHSPPSRH